MWTEINTWIIWEKNRLWFYILSQIIFLYLMLSDDFVTSFGGELSPSCLSHQQIFSKLNTLLLARAGQVTLVLASSQIKVWNAWCWKKFDKIFYMPVLLVVGVNFQGVIFSYFHLSKYTQLVLCSMFNSLPPCDAIWQQKCGWTLA